MSKILLSLLSVWFSRKPEEKRTRTGSDHADNGVRIEELILEEGTAFCCRLHLPTHPPPPPPTPSYHNPSVRLSLPLIEIPSRCVFNRFSLKILTDGRLGMEPMKTASKKRGPLLICIIPVSESGRPADMPCCSCSSSEIFPG
jgi:hypothetical protein